MHPLWDVAELVTGICSFLEPGDACPLALVSRRFYVPAMGRIWHRIPLEYLLRCLPADAFKNGENAWPEPVSPLSMSHYSITIVKPARVLNHQDWERAVEISRHVRYLTVQSGHCFTSLKANMSKHFFPLIVPSLPHSTPLFPLLTNLHFEVRFEAMVPFLHVLLRPTLQQLSLALSIKDSPKGYASICNLIKTLPVHCPQIFELELLRFSCSVVPKELVNALWDAALDLHHLKIFVPPQITATHVMSSSTPGHSGILPQLTSLSVEDITIGWLRRFIQVAGGGGLTKLISRSILRPSSLEWETFFQELSVKSRGLKVLVLADFLRGESDIFLHDYEPDTNLSDVDSHTLTPSNLQPLLQCSQLRQLFIPWVNAAVDTDFVADLALALPNLCTLELGNKCQDDDLCYVPLTSLATLAQCCPNLCTVGLLFDATEDMEPTESLPVERNYSQLDRSIELVVGKSEISDPTHVAIFLSALFERVRIYTSNHLEDMWRQVEELVPPMAMVRRQESIRPGVQQ